MILRDFIKTNKNQKFLNTRYGNIETKNALIEKIREKVMEWLAMGNIEETIKDEAIRYILNDYEPLTIDLKVDTDNLLKKWKII